MEFFETVINRHSYRGPFLDKAVDPDRHPGHLRLFALSASFFGHKAVVGFLFLVVG
jgi:hypothetical protein